MDREKHIKEHQSIIATQKQLCERYSVEWYPSPPDMKIGISKNVRSGLMPINGLRHSPEGETTGWYIWAGREDINNDPKLWDGVHIDHLSEYLPLVVKYLGLPPGWRFQIDDKGYEDIWEDKSLLHS